MSRNLLKKNKQDYEEAEPRNHDNPIKRKPGNLGIIKQALGTIKYKGPGSKLKKIKGL